MVHPQNRLRAHPKMGTGTSKTRSQSPFWELKRRKEHQSGTVGRPCHNLAHQTHGSLHHISAIGAKRDSAHHESQSRHREVPGLQSQDQGQVEKAVVARSPDRATRPDRRSPTSSGELRSAERHGQETVPQPVETVPQPECRRARSQAPDSVPRQPPGIKGPGPG
jgi:hypothetical protein